MQYGDNFMLGPYHFVYMGEKNGRIEAMTYIPNRGIFKYSLDAFTVMMDPTFRLIKSYNRVISEYIKEKR